MIITIVLSNLIHLQLDHGNLFVGPNGIIISDLKAMGVVVIEGGKVIGNIEADRLVLRGHASVQGDVTCSSVEMGPQSTMIGQMKSVFDPAEAALKSPKKKETLQMAKNGNFMNIHFSAYILLFLHQSEVNDIFPLHSVLHFDDVS